MENKDWLAQLQVGDTVIVGGGRTLAESYVTKITRMTPTQIITRENPPGRYKRTTGRRVGDGDSYFSAYLTPATEESLKAIRVVRAKDYLRRVTWSEVGDDFALDLKVMIQAHLEGR